MHKLAIEGFRRAKVILMSEHLRRLPEKGDDLYYLKWFLEVVYSFGDIVYLKGGFDDYKSRFPAAVTNVKVTDLNRYFSAHHNSLMGYNDLLVLLSQAFESEISVLLGCLKILSQQFEGGRYTGLEHMKALHCEKLSNQYTLVKESVSFTSR